MTEVQQARGGFLQFMTTVPGVLTSIAAVITALTGTGLYVGISHHTDSASAPVNPVMTSEAAPAPATSVDQGSLRLSNATAGVNDLGNNDPVAGLISQCAAGDDAACASILDILIQECNDAAGLPCDVLYEISPIGSDYEAFGASCGDRWPNEDYADLCGEQ